MAFPKADWMNIKTDTLGNVAGMAEAFAKVQAAMAVTASEQEAFQELFLKAFRADGHDVPAGKHLIYSYKRGKLAIAMVDNAKGEKGFEFGTASKKGKAA